MNELVRLTTQDVGKGIPMCSSREVSEHFKKRHSDVIAKIEGKERGIKREIGLMEEIECTGNPVDLYFIESSYVNEQNSQKYKEYLLTRDGFSLLVMGFTGKEALEWKLKYINAFNLMESELKARQETRHIGISVRKALTDSIKENINDDGNFKKFAYSTYSKLVYKKVLGKTVKKTKEELGLKEKDNIRNHLTIEELEKVQTLESKIAMYIETLKDMDLSDKETYEKIKIMLEK